MSQDVNLDFYAKNSYQPELQLLQAIRKALVDGVTPVTPGALVLPFDPAIGQVYISLFQRGLQPIRWGGRKKTLQATLERVVEKIRALESFSTFAVADASQCRILFEMVTGERSCNIRNMTGMSFGDNRFEPGVTGLKYVHAGVTRYFMPTDAVVHSIMSVPQVLQFLAKKTGIAKQTKRFSEREQLMRSEPIAYSFIQSIAFISYQEQILPLYRGYPVPVLFDKATLLQSTLKSIDWLIENMNSEGSFLYYYDGYLDSKIDFDHPKMIDPLYNNILRHSGGTITLLRGYELTGEPRYLKAAEHSIGFLLSTCREHEYQGQYACYPFDNKKSKLGGAGIGLVALMHHYHHTQSEQYRKHIDGIVRHILSRVDADGEMIGYYIHPLFNNGQPLINPSDEVKKQLFSFYYPGEALLGLALYYHWINDIDADLKAEIHSKSLMALDFLVDVRPVKYQELFLSLPADAWLMQAIEEWVKVEEFRKQSYIDFVFNDARTMIEHAYQKDDAHYFDYVGGFYYNYGDHVYHDASRCEGLVAAYYLACYLNNTEQADVIMQQMLKSAKGLMYTRHTPESTYAHLYPEKSINSFRFKLTRQWVRVDSVQHAACFFSRLHMCIDDAGLVQSQAAPADKNEILTSPKTTLSISMIVKNEASHIARVLENVWLFADEVIIVDTGSTDDTVKIAESLGATIYHFKWCQDFAKARNASLSYCTKDFVMWLDADDVLEREDALRLKQLLHKEMPWDVIYLPYYYHSNPINKTNGMRKKPPRIFRNHIGIKWIDPIHESLLYPRKISKNQAIDDINIYHQPLRESTANALRNLNIMFEAANAAENLGSSYHLWHIAKEYNNLKNQRLAIEYFKKALHQGNHARESSFRRSRLYYGLGKQYKRLKEYPSAIEAYALCAINYDAWREPFVSIAECYRQLGAYDLALTYLNVAETIPRHALQIEVAEFYAASELDKMRATLLAKISSPPIAQTKREKSNNKFHLFAGGDVCLGRQMPDYTVVKGEARAFENIQSLTQNADIFLVNLECVISNVGRIIAKGGKRPFHYRGHPIVLDSLVSAGINVVTTANNHSMDYGAPALLEQNELLSACHIAHPGSGRSLENASCAQFISVGDTIVAVISIDTETPEFKVQPGKAGISVGKNDEEVARILLAAIAHAKRYADLIVVSPHWGANWKDVPSQQRRELAYLIIDAGADLILGHSAHILQGIEVYKGRAIAYDMGTLLFDRVSENRMRFTALFELEFGQEGFTKLIIHPVKLQRGCATIANQEDAKYIRELVKSLSRSSESSHTVFNEVGENLELALGNYAKVDLSKKSLEPEDLYHKSNLMRLPRYYHQRPNTAQISNVPEPLTNNKPIVLNNGLSFIGANCPDLVKPGFGFVLQLYFKTETTIAGHWELMVIGRFKSDPVSSFEFAHPITEGVYPIALWQPDAVVCDEFIVRPPPALTKGEYQIFWKIYNRDTLETLFERNDGIMINEFWLGDITVSDKAEDGVAGLDSL